MSAAGDRDRTSSDAWALADQLVLAAVEAQVLGSRDHAVQIGRYRIERPLGAGAMGRIVLAYDEQLQRQVALKLISPHLTDVPAARERIVREARAMAKLSDPHVAQVYEVGEDDDQLFVAMEYVAGQDLRRWLHAEPRTWRQIVDVFVQAGQGLAAAHDKGLVHRDFKPDNVMLEEDGRARVVDFGLARGSGEADGETDARPDDAPATLTSTGTWLGTPAYMAPEQWDGAEVDARSDQFAFCVSLYEALAGIRPFAGETGGQVRAALDRGEVPAIARSKRIPRRIEAAIRRGLQTDPSRRWPSMAPLLRALAPRSRTWMLVVGSTTALAVAIGLTATRGDPCADAGHDIVEVWNDARVESTRAAIEGMDVSWAAATAAAVTPRYTATADAWRQASQAVCATEDASPAATRCLAYARDRLADEIETVASGDPARVVAAVSRAELLADPRACLQSSDDAWPDTEDTRAYVHFDEATRLLGRLSTAEGAQDYVTSLAAGRTAAAEAFDAAKKSGDMPLAAKAAWLRGRLALRDSDKVVAETFFREAAETAAAAGQAPLRAAANVELVYLVGNDRDRTEEAESLAADAGALLSGMGNPPVWTARLDAHRASVLAHARQTRATKAIELHTRATERLRDVLGEDHPDVIIQLGNLGAAYNYAALPEPAQAALREALERARRVWGDAHPRTARLEGTLGLARMRAKDLDGAQQYLRHSLQVRAAVLGEDHSEVASARYNLALVLRMQGEHEPALALLRRGLQTRERERGPDDPGHVTWLALMGGSELALGETGQARTDLQRALDLLERAGGDPERFGELRLMLARAWADSDPDKARVLAEWAQRGTTNEADRTSAEKLLAELAARRP